MGYSQYNGYLPIQPSTYLQNKITKVLTSLILTLNSENYYKRSKLMKKYHTRHNVIKPRSAKT
jgi:hypothetical protein